MNIFRNVSIKKYNTFGLDYKADRLIHLRREEEARDLFVNNKSDQFLIIGGGSNLLFTSDFNGTILRSEFSGIKIENKSTDNVLISAGAGVEWDHLVEWSVGNGLAGMENLSLIPGTVGATPVQNIGAYGVEVKDIIEKVKTIDTNNGAIRWFTKSECEFSYRNSVFKGTEKGRFLITRVYYNLKTRPIFNLSYGTLKEEVFNLGDATLFNVRNAVIKIRRNKLPDPAIIGNAGSFYKNPVVESQIADSLKYDYPLMPYYESLPGSVKLAAGWLIEQCGWKGIRKNDAGVHSRQALVLVNYGNATGKEIYDLSEEIKLSVLKKFGIKLEYEVEIIGTI